jgi:hypothetical protein
MNCTMIYIGIEIVDLDPFVPKPSEPKLLEHVSIAIAKALQNSGNLSARWGRGDVA